MQYDMTCFSIKPISCSCAVWLCNLPKFGMEGGVHYFWGLYVGECKWRMPHGPRQERFWTQDQKGDGNMIYPPFSSFVWVLGPALSKSVSVLVESVILSAGESRTCPELSRIKWNYIIESLDTQCRQNKLWAHQVITTKISQDCNYTKQIYHLFRIYNTQWCFKSVITNNSPIRQTFCGCAAQIKELWQL